jgi:hypothetical protein
LHAGFVKIGPFRGDVMKWILVLVAALLMSAAQAGEGGGQFEWKCTDTSRNSMQCTFKNNAEVSDDLCMDVVKVCKDGDHVATICTGTLRPHETDTKVVKGFDPKIRLFEKCQGVEYRNKVTSR